MSDEKKSLELMEIPATDIVSLDGEVIYTLDDVRRLYVSSLYTPEHIAKQLNIDVSRVIKPALEEDWNQIRLQRKEQILTKIQETITSLIQGQIENHIKAIERRDFASNKQGEWFNNYLNKHGDLFARDPQSGEILTTILGQPIDLKLPGSTNEIKNKMLALEYLRGQYIILREFANMNVSGIQTKAKLLDYKTIDLTPYNLFEPTKSDDER